MWCGTSIAEDHADSQPLPDHDAQVDMDEVIIRGRMSKKQLRRQIEAVDQDIFSLFNDVNMDDNYDIVCRKTAPIGSQIPQVTCKARLYWDELSDLSQDDDHVLFALGPLSDPAGHAAMFRRKLLEAARQDPKLFDALIKRRRLEMQAQRLNDGDDG